MTFHVRYLNHKETFARGWPCKQGTQVPSVENVHTERVVNHGKQHVLCANISEGVQEDCSASDAVNLEEEEAASMLIEENTGAGTSSGSARGQFAARAALQ
jgi:hypothetical protein